MVRRIFAIALNGYREAFRARILYGLFAAALGTSGYSIVVASLSLNQEPRVIADLGAGSISLYAVLVSLVIGATSLHRELELKTIFPILTRRLRRHEYVVGKYLGIVLTVAVFVALDAAGVLGILAFETGQKPALVLGALGLLGAILAVVLLRAKYTRIYVFIPWTFAVALAMYLLASTAGLDRQLVVASALLTMCEVLVVAAVAMLFSSFSSPFLTAVFTLGIFLVGRSADTLANLPVKFFGQAIRTTGQVLARVFPNLHLYVPPRPLLLGMVPTAPLGSYLATSALYALAYATALITFGAIIFRKRDFQ